MAREKAKFAVFSVRQDDRPRIELRLDHAHSSAMKQFRKGAGPLSGVSDRGGRLAMPRRFDGQSEIRAEYVATTARLKLCERGLAG
jgi:hypothetical protein